MKANKFILIILFFVGSTTSCTSQEKRPTSQNANLVGLVKTSEDAGKVITLSGNFNGFNAQMMRGPSWQAPGFVERVKELQPGLIRYPGGTVASYWDWKTGWLMEGIELKSEWKSIQTPNPIKLEDLKFACDKSGAQPLYVLNLMNSTVRYQLEMLNAAKKLGLPVNYIELDNELYLGEGFYVKKFPSGKDYAIEANKWIIELKKEFPNARIAVVGSSVKEGAAKKEKKFAERTNNWNREVLAEIKGADAITFHVYGGSGFNFLSNQLESDNENETAKEKASSMQTAFDKPGSIAFILGSPFMRWNNANTYDYKILPKGMKAWVTEYNLFEREGVLAGTWAHGLYALSQTLLFLENPATELICFHNLTTSAQFAAIFNNNQGFAKALKPKTTKQFDFTAAGHCLALSGQAMAEGGLAVKLNFSNNESLSANRGQKYPSLNGWIVKGNKQKKVIVTNLSSKAVTVDFSEIITGDVTFTQLDAIPQQQIAKEEDLHKTSGAGSKIKLPAYLSPF
ncbi:MAG: hypothetical protein IPP71_01275 [Bacteroidetes bacterium]|nr:hypothetical protein [Bacteroidota bacterium]